MSHLQVIERLEEMLRMALGIIKEQSAILEMHGISTDDGQLEQAEQRFLDDMERWC